MPVRFPSPTINKTAISAASDARLGTPFTWQLLIGNSDSAATLFAYDVVDTLPPGWTFVPGSATVTGVTGWRDASSRPARRAPSIVGQVLTWSNVGNLPPSSTATITLQATPNMPPLDVSDLGVGHQHTNTAVITGDDGSGSPTLGVSPYTASSSRDALIRLIDLEVDKNIVTPSPYVFGQDVTYTVSVTNAATLPGDIATGVVLEDVLPPGLVFISQTSITQGTYVPGTGVWTIGTLSPGATVTLTMLVDLNAEGTIVNTAQISAADQFDVDSTPDNDLLTEDDQDAVTINVTPRGLGDTVWFDRDADGTQDVGEPGLPDVKVTLLDLGPDGVVGGGDDDVPVVLFTNSSGNYIFADLRIDRNYLVTVDPTTLPAGMAQTYDLDGLVTANSVITMVPATSILTVDFGYNGTGSIGDTVFYDDNDNGAATADPGEPPLANVPVTVVWAGPDGVIGGANAADDVAFSTTTSTSGMYLVTGLPAGSYSVTVDSSALPAGMTPTFDLDGVLATPDVATMSLTPGQNRLDVDFSYTGTSSIGDRVWLDQNGDGIQDPGEPGLPGLTVTLTWTGANSLTYTTTTTTGLDGAYLFPNLPSGTYTVTVHRCPRSTRRSISTARRPRTRWSPSTCRRTPIAPTSTSATEALVPSATRCGSTRTTPQARPKTSASRALPTLMSQSSGAVPTGSSAERTRPTT